MLGVAAFLKKAHYYEELYKSSDPAKDDINKYLDKITILRIIEEHRRNLDGNITMQEVEWVEITWFRWTNSRVLYMF